MARYHLGTWKLAELLCPVIDTMDFGEETRSGTIVAVPENWELEAFLNKERRFLRERLTKTQLQMHLQNERTYYYRPSRKSNLALLCVDIDPPKGTEEELRALGIPNTAITYSAPPPEIEKVAEYLALNYLEGAYYEPSTHNRGYHLYFLVDRGKVDCAKFNQIVEDFAHLLHDLVAEQRYEAEVCSINGTYTPPYNDIDFSDPNLECRKKVTRGRMAKMPCRPLLPFTLAHPTTCPELFMPKGTLSVPPRVPMSVTVYFTSPNATVPTQRTSAKAAIRNMVHSLVV